VLTLPSSVRIFVAAEAVDLRRGFDGLAAATRSVIREEPESGHLFVFLNRRRNRIKLLVWDRTGYLIVYKRLEAGTFALATAPLVKRQLAGLAASRRYLHQGWRRQRGEDNQVAASP
jgi:transposase